MFLFQGIRIGLIHGGGGLYRISGAPCTEILILTFFHHSIEFSSFPLSEEVSGEAEMYGLLVHL